MVSIPIVLVYDNLITLYEATIIVLLNEMH